MFVRHSEILKASVYTVLLMPMTVGCSDPGIPTWEEVDVRSARPWTLPDGTTLSGKTVAENQHVILIECGRLYSRFNGHVLLRVSQLNDDDREFLRKLDVLSKRLNSRKDTGFKKWMPTKGILPGDVPSMSEKDREATISLSQISLALQSYRIAHQGNSPPLALYADDGTGLLSWRVLILPYIGEAKLFEEFHLGEPWDSDHNRQLIDRIPLTYSAGSEKSARGQTRYLAPTGKETFWETRGGLATKEISDGFALTICAVEVRSDHSVVWTKPEDLTIDLEAPSISLDWADTDGFPAAFSDGRMAFLSRKLGKGQISKYFTRNRHEVIPLLGDPQPRFPHRPG